MARRVHLTGSASPECDPQLLRFAHAALGGFAREHLRAGGSLIAGLGGESTHPSDPGLPLIFDWTLIEAAVDALRAGEAEPSAEDPLVILRGSNRGFEKIPDHRRGLYDELVARGALDLKLLPDTWRSGALIRQAQARHGDVLLIASGGAGAEHLADLYAERGRPVVPWHIDLGSAGGDGALGGIGLAKKTLADAAPFFALEDPGGEEARLLALRIDAARLADPDDTARGLVGLIGDLERPNAFCIRLLNPAIEPFAAVEEHFRQVVDPVLEGLGYRVIDLGRDRQESVWMNQEVFVRLDRAALAFCDLSAQRPNCFTELGYALGNRQRVIISAHEDESMPFDTDKLPYRSWSPREGVEERRRRLREHIDLFGTLPPLVESASFL